MDLSKQRCTKTQSGHLPRETDRIVLWVFNDQSSWPDPKKAVHSRNDLLNNQQIVGDHE